VSPRGRTSAGDRLRRLLANRPGLAAHPGATVDEISERFGTTPTQLLDDLNVVWMVGIPPYTPDQLIDLEIDDDRVTVDLGSYFRRPLRLTPAQAVALVAAGQSLVSVPGTDPEGPLARGLAKLAAALQVDPAEAMAVHLGDAASATVERLRDAIRDGRRVRIDYYSFGRDERSERDVDPHRVWAEGGSWYLSGWCHKADGGRVFRLDRIGEVEVLDEVATTTPGRDETGVFNPSAGDPTVVLDLDPEAAWVLDYYPHEESTVGDDGRIEVELPVASVRWLEQLLVRLGPSAEVVEVRGDVPADTGATAARRVLARYGR
jgi:proteasome accessory factor C